MSLRIVRISSRWHLWSAIVAVAISCGCTSMPEDIEPRDESFTEAAGYQRKPEKVSLPWAMTDRGRQIEKDFGVNR